MRARTVLVSFLFTGLVAGQAAAEQIQRPLGTTMDYPATGVSEAHESNIIFVNYCFPSQNDGFNGCDINRGYPDDATRNISFIPNSDVVIAPYSGGQATADAITQCLRAMYEPFDIQIVTERPASGAYFMAIVAGNPTDVGMSPQVGGVAPAGCGVIDRAVTYTFAEIYGGAVQQICETAAQETAHAFGLDHEYYCPDPMTYLYGCGAKQFRDYDAPCGEGSARQCSCGGSTQNSYQRLLAEFGPSTPTPPSVTITDPMDNSQVEPGFVIRLEATDDVAVERVLLRIDGAQVLELTQGPFVFNAPADLGEGGHSIEVCAYDNRDSEGCDSINVVLGEPCTKNSHCEDGEVCVEGRCVPGPGNPGGLGEACTTGDECNSGLCASDGSGNSFCTESCTIGGDGCPSGFQCLDAGGTGVCWPGADGGGGCAANGDSSSGLPVAFAVLFGVFLVWRRRA